MSGVVLDVPVASAKPSFGGVFGAVLLGYIVAAVTVVALVWGARHELGLLTGPFAHHGPFPLTGAWSLAADLGAATVLVLVTATVVRAAIEHMYTVPVSFGVVVVAVAVSGLVSFLTLSPVTLLIPLVSMAVATWIVRRYGIGDAAPFRRVPWQAWAALAVVALGVFLSYNVYHPLTEDGGFFAGIDARLSGTYSSVVTLHNPGLADVTILRVDGGSVDGRRGGPVKLPTTLAGRSQTDLTVFHKGCARPDVNITYSVLGRTASQRFTVGSVKSCQR